MMGRAALATIRSKVARLAEAERMVEELMSENDKVRASMGNSALPCVYCGLDAAEQARCASGFPGCGRADDQMMCPHFAAELGLAARIAVLTETLERLERLCEDIRCDGMGALHDADNGDVFAAACERHRNRCAIAHGASLAP